jgi:hypothetical protein
MAARRTTAEGRSRLTFRRVVVRFRVPHAIRVRVLVRQVAPVCRRLGVYTVAAKRGTNMVRLPKRIGKHRLGAGTYLLTAKSHGKPLFKARARLVRGRTLVLHRGGKVATCEGAGSAEPVVLRTSAPASELHGVKGRVASGTIRTPRPEPPGASSQMSPLVRAISLDYAPNPLRPFLLVLLGAAIALLAVGALPQSVLPARAGTAFVAEQRGWIVAAGIWLIAIVVVVTTFA